MRNNDILRALQNVGLTPVHGCNIVLDGRINRFDIEGRPRGKKHGWMIGHMDHGKAFAVFGDWQTGQREQWRNFDPDELPEDDRQAYFERQKEAEQAAKDERHRVAGKAAKKAASLVAGAVPVDTLHPYIQKKGIRAFGAFQHLDEILLPIRDIDGVIASLQRINETGKRFLTGGVISGNFLLIGESINTPTLLMCEGWATGCSLHEATGLPVVVCFSANNMVTVTKRLAERLSDNTTEIVVCGDNDSKTTGNPGKAAAEKAASLIPIARVVLPCFESYDPEDLTDFNDLHQVAGLDSVREQIEAALAAPTAQPLNENSQVEHAQQWPAPQPIPCTLRPVPSFDFELLPESLRPWVQDIAERMQCPPDFPAVAAVVAISSVVGRKACIRPKRKDDWVVVPNLWGMIVGRPGMMKSPALAEVLKPLDRLAAQAGEQHKSAMEEHAVQLQMQAMIAKANEAKAQKLLKENKDEQAKQLLMGMAKAENISAPPLRRYKVTDASMEALGEIHIENPLGVLVYRDEMNGLLRGLDKEGQEGARAFYLQGYDGNQGYTFDRIHRGRNLHIPAVCIALLGGIQPGKLQTYIHDAVTGGAGDDGLLQRFGLLVWPDTGGEWRNVDEWPDSDARRAAHATFERLDSMPPAIDEETGEQIPKVYRFTEDAQEEFNEWRQSFENELRAGEMHPAMESHLSKYRKLVPALALVCALADGEQEVGHNSLLRALAWSEYLCSHAERAYSAGAMPDTNAARALLAKIREGKIDNGFSPRDIYLKGWAHLSTPEAVHGAARMLCDLYHLQRVEQKPGAGGGRPTQSYMINPATKRSA